MDMCHIVIVVDGMCRWKGSMGLMLDTVPEASISEKWGFITEIIKNTPSLPKALIR